jgi:EAL domain-containing protein (putative c-di-GMP-specific phosphodiesterase class I)
VTAVYRTSPRPGLIPAPRNGPGAARDERLARLLARPGGVISVHRPIVRLDDGRCTGYAARALIEDGDRLRHPDPPEGDPDPADGSSGAEDAGPAAWFRAAARTGLSGRLGAAALSATLRERATLPGDRFLMITLDPPALAHPDVVAVLEDEDDVADLTLSLLRPDVPRGHRALGVLHELRARGLQLAVPAGPAGVGDLRVVERRAPDVIVIGAGLVRDVHRHRVRQRLTDVIVELAEDSGATTLAEEVESLNETQTLRALGVRMADGWLFGRPRRGFAPPPAQVCEWLRLQQIDLR